MTGGTTYEKLGWCVLVTGRASLLAVKCISQTYAHMNLLRLPAGTFIHIAKLEGIMDGFLGSSSNFKDL